MRVEILREANESQLCSALAFSAREFEAYFAANKVRAPENVSSSSIAHWAMLVREKSGCLFMCMGDDDRLESASTSSNNDTINNNGNNNNMDGFVFTYTKGAYTHIWLAITASHARQKGVMQTLFNAVESRARASGFTQLSVNTMPSVFTAMPGFLLKNGFVKVAESLVAEGTPLQTARWSFTKTIEQ
ncbi:hypothetical protein BJ741DRAFT_372925 [Chytriomyces cf. hyalinus JEL632]|nr:hypothetical protein BJ741DRAFT_372925 [Chytriomyces cf. hyalinus JEL632]